MMDESQVQAYGTGSVTGRCALVLAPHPDDEVLGCGGVLALHRRAGDRTRVVFLTGGEAGENAAAYDEYATLRREEARRACARLGVGQVDFWDGTDRRLVDAPALRRRLAALLEEERPGIVYAPSPLELHPDHKTCAHAIWRVARETARPFDLLFWEAGYPLRPNLLVDIGEAVEEKRAAMDCYASQQAVRNYRDMILGLARYRSLCAGAGVTHAEAFWRVRAPDEVCGSLGAAYARLTQIEGADAFRAGLSVGVCLLCGPSPDALRASLLSLSAQTLPPAGVAVVPPPGTEAAALRGVAEEFDGVLPLSWIEPDARNEAARANAAWKAWPDAEAILFLRTGDRAHPDHLLQLAKTLRNAPGGVACSAFEIASFSEPPSPSPAPHIQCLAPPAQENMERTQTPPPATILLERHTLEAAGGLKETASDAALADLVRRLARETPFAFASEPTCAVDPAANRLPAETVSPPSADNAGELAHLRALMQTRPFRCALAVRRLAQWFRGE